MESSSAVAGAIHQAFPLRLLRFESIPERVAPHAFEIFDNFINDRRSVDLDGERGAADTTDKLEWAFGRKFPYTLEVVRGEADYDA